MAEMTNKERKRMQKAQYHNAFRTKASSSTTGKMKNIVASPLQRGMCARNRSWRNPAYEAVMASLGRRANKK